MEFFGVGIGFVRSSQRQTQHLNRHLNIGQRNAQLVGHRTEEIILKLVKAFEFHRLSLRHPQKPHLPNADRAVRGHLFHPFMHQRIKSLYCRPGNHQLA